jgi:hypothetical protein
LGLLLVFAHTCNSNGSSAGQTAVYIVNQESINMSYQNNGNDNKGSWEIEARKKKKETSRRDEILYQDESCTS